jgi:hypothetical protein
VFRVLDLDGDGQLSGSEHSAGVRGVKALAGGRVTKEEYRDYFRRRVEAKTETLTAAIKSNEALMRKLTGGEFDKGIGLPEWFNSLDADKDKQVSLYEWRKAGKPLSEFQAMDLNGDGLLTTDEYVRWAKMKREEEERREDDR